MDLSKRPMFGWKLMRDHKISNSVIGNHFQDLGYHFQEWHRMEEEI